MAKVTFSVSDRVEREGVGEVGSSLELFQAIYRNPGFPLPLRMRAAIAAIPFEHAKLAVTAIVPDGGRFAEQLERAIARSQAVRVITVEAQAAPASTDVTLRPSVPDRRFRR
jgi:hypothetical protein